MPISASRLVGDRLLLDGAAPFLCISLCRLVMWMAQNLLRPPVETDRKCSCLSNGMCGPCVLLRIC